MSYAKTSPTHIYAAKHVRDKMPCVTKGQAQRKGYAIGSVCARERNVTKVCNHDMTKGDYHMP